MLKCTTCLVLCLFVQVWAQQTISGSIYNPFLSYNYPYLRYPRRAQSVYDIDPSRRSNPAYDVTPPRRSQPVYGVDPPRRSQPAYGVDPPRRSQPAYDVDPPRRSQPAYDVNPPTRSQSAYEINTKQVYEPRVSQDSNVVVKSNDTPSYGQGNRPGEINIRQVYEPRVTQDSNVVVKSFDTTSYGQENRPAEQVEPVALKSPSAYWVEPYRSDGKTPLADDTASITAKDGSVFEGNQRDTNPVSQPRPGSNVGNEPNCILPPLPEHGSYVKNDPNPTMRLASEIVTINVTCDRGYIIHGASTVHCYNGFWADDMPKCLPVTCPLKQHHSVEYRCLVIGDVVGSRKCHEEEPVGTMVSPLCRKPHFYSTSNNLAFMHCGEDGTWDHVAKCTPECGTVTANGHGLVVGGQAAKRGELPWHVGVYLKRFTPYMQVCGGTLISSKLIISAAHCFWDDLQKQLPASDFAVAVGKLYRPWDDKMDESQKSDVKEIHMPPRFQGASSNFQDDIAVVIPVDAFEYRIHVRPVCLSFDSHFDRLQLQTVNKGKVAGWGLTAADGKPSPVLQVLELPYVEVGTCIEHSPPTFVAHITSDKICAGDKNTTTALCRGDSGGGLTFVATDRDTPRYYLRGIVSTAPSDEHDCNTHTYTSFTHVQKHEDFIKQFITEA